MKREILTVLAVFLTMAGCGGGDNLANAETIYLECRSLLKKGPEERKVEENITLNLEERWLQVNSENKESPVLMKDISLEPNIISASITHRVEQLSAEEKVIIGREDLSYSITIYYGESVLTRRGQCEKVDMEKNLI